ncbi:MAG: hypothetical protein ACTS73_04110 [Arsenophonus sp. NEOnobi-MAG3]
MIDFMNDFNKVEILYHEKSTIQLSAKANITSDLLHELIRNSTRKLIATAVKIKLKAML